jgi:hypothetical protein
VETIGFTFGLLLLALSVYGFANLRSYPSADEDRVALPRETTRIRS